MKIFKKWWFWLIVVIVIVAIAGANGKREKDNQAADTKPDTTTVSSIPSSTPEPNPVDQAKRDIDNKTREYIKKYDSTSIKEIMINEHMGTDDPDDYIVLAHLSFDAKNRAKTAKDMIDMYASDLAANLAKSKNVTEVTVFWEVPYLKEGINIAKTNFLRKGDNMYIENAWHDPNIFGREDKR
ncbi:hypothetical protein M5W76_22120 [Paenibacillus larvae]|uniref:Uncharacterized protein n=1 Tax=Paenibacillus phage PBL1c TaxID=2070194 RepID=A0A2I7SC66_9CAUD|nr:hypothetical protein [Paenibacillus larvae]YP_009836361.1 hypothetical protein HWB44_gp31 [Paenibacillus phage PBL1c]AUS03503.1 hypothetical protein PBL1C_31 [Paenibacillus phage PBL1c]MCY9721048.1 hypothetical protein [Paenibacillus larvae]